MKAFSAFTKKEFTESIRTYKLPVMAAVFVLLGIMGPLMIQLLPWILKMSAGDMPEGMVMELPELGAMDSWTQFFGQISQMGTLTLAIVLGGIMGNEFRRGTLVLLLTKGMKRRKVLLAKFTAATAIWSICYLLALAACFFYTTYFWGSVQLSHAFVAFVSPWLFGVFLIALLIFGGVVFRNFLGPLVLYLGVTMVMSLFGLYPPSNKYNPSVLAMDKAPLLAGRMEVAEFAPAIVVCILLTAGLVIGAIVLFDKREL